MLPQQKARRSAPVIRFDVRSIQLHAAFGVCKRGSAVFQRQVGSGAVGVQNSARPSLQRRSVQLDGTRKVLPCVHTPRDRSAAGRLARRRGSGGFCQTRLLGEATHRQRPRSRAFLARRSSSPPPAAARDQSRAGAQHALFQRDAPSRGAIQAKEKEKRAAPSKVLESHGRAASAATAEHVSGRGRTGPLMAARAAMTPCQECLPQRNGRFATTPRQPPLLTRPPPRLTPEPAAPPQDDSRCFPCLHSACRVGACP